MPDDAAIERDPRTVRPQGLAGRRSRARGVAERAARITAWSLAHFLFVLVQQVAELIAPLLLIAGIGWAALPRVVGMIQTSDGQMRDILNGLQSHIPTSVTLGGHLLTPSDMIFDGIGLLVLSALLSTLLGIIDRELYRGP